MLKVKGTVLIGLSTMGGPRNYYDELFEDTDPLRDKLFIKIKVDLVCKSCKDKELPPSSCKHLEHLHPSWLISSNTERVKVFTRGDEEVFAREVLSTEFANGSTVFKDRWVQALRERVPRPVQAHRCKFLMTMIDPGGSGTSRSAVVTIARETQGDIIIAGLGEANLVAPSDMPTFVSTYLAHFAKDPEMRHIPHFISIERNYGGPTLVNEFMRVALETLPTIVEHTTCPNKPGTWTGEETNKSGTLSLMWDLIDDKIHFAPFLATESEHGLSLVFQPGSHQGAPNIQVAHGLSTSGSGPNHRETLFQQMGQIHKEFRANQNSFRFTGKTSNGGKDDLVMSLIMAVYHSLTIATMAFYHEL
jgi:hypothetical protein